MRLLNLAKKLERLKKDPEQTAITAIWVIYDEDEPPDPATRQRVVQEARARGGRARYLVIYWPLGEEER